MNLSLSPNTHGPHVVAWFTVPSTDNCPALAYCSGFFITRERFRLADEIRTWYLVIRIRTRTTTMTWEILVTALAQAECPIDVESGQWIAHR